MNFVVFNNLSMVTQDLGDRENNVLGFPRSWGVGPQIWR